MGTTTNHSRPAGFDTEILIIGGGPVGLALAGELGWRGRRCILLEQTDGIVHHPKMDGIDLRVMEFCRRWGIVDEMKTFPFPKRYPQDMVYVTSLTGYELGRESFTSPSGTTEAQGDGPSPESRFRCPQTHFDPILRRFAETHSGVSIRTNARYIALEQDDEGVTVLFEDIPSGKELQLRARHVVGCDGANSIVRQQLGIGFTGVGLHNYTTNVMFRAADLFAIHDKRPGYRWLFIGPEGLYGTMSAINGRDEWRAQLFNDEKRAMEPDDIRARLERMVGQPFEFELISTLHWARRELVAERYRSGRVFLAGDACHATSPTGGFGMNTGIKDAVDLAWKLDATLSGWAGPRLLDTYDEERKPMGLRAVREASGNWRRMVSVGRHPKLLEPGYEGALLRYDVGRKFSATMLREWYKNGIDLGYVYAGSSICWPDEPAAAPHIHFEGQELPPCAMPRGHMVDGAPLTATTLREWQRLLVHLAEGNKPQLEWEELPAAEVMVYRQSSAPGSRAPHAWLDNGRSTLDWFGRSFVLLRLGENPPCANDFKEQAQRASMPVEIIDCTLSSVIERYRRSLVLVRPDGHVAWRANAWPADGVAALLARVRGA